MLPPRPPPTLCPGLLRNWFCVIRRYRVLWMIINEYLHEAMIFISNECRAKVIRAKDSAFIPLRRRSQLQLTLRVNEIDRKTGTYRCFDFSSKLSLTRGQRYQGDMSHVGIEKKGDQRDKH
jgi:hypothetical protein